MGEIADDIVSGGQCSWCGTMFVQDHGFPVLCQNCWNDAHEDGEDPRKIGLQKATHDEL